MSLRRQALIGIKWTSASMVVLTVIQFSQMSIMARLLEPADFGLMAIMMVFIGFSQAFQDMGLSNAIIQRESISDVQLSSLYWLNISSGIIVGLLLLGLSPLIAGFFDAPKLQAPMALLSGVFILSAVGNQYRVLCQKALDFNTIESINVIAALISFFGGVFAAISGFGVFSLVIATLLQAGFASFLFLWIGSRRYKRPLFIYSHSSLKGFYQFGFYQMGERSINYLSANIDKLLIGKLVGVSSAGLYDLAWRLVIFPLTKINPIVNKIAFPVYSQIQNDSTALNHYYRLSLAALSVITLPLLACLAFFSEEVVSLLFGDQWRATADLLPALALIGAIKALGNPGGALILALGRADIGFWWNLFWAISVVLGLLVGLWLRPSADTAVCVVLGLSFSVGLIWHIIIARTAKVEYLPILKHISQLAVVIIMLGKISVLFVNSVDLIDPILRLVVGISCFSVTYLYYIYVNEKVLIRSFLRS